MFLKQLQNNSAIPIIKIDSKVDNAVLSFPRWHCTVLFATCRGGMRHVEQLGAERNFTGRYGRSGVASCEAWRAGLKVLRVPPALLQTGDGVQEHAPHG